MSIDTNAKYTPPKEYQPKNKDFTPKMKPSSAVITVIAGIIAVLLIIAAIIGAVFGIIKLVETIQNNNKNQSSNTLVIEDKIV